MSTADAEPVDDNVRAELAVVLVLVAGVAIAAGAVSFTHVKDWTMENLPAGSPDWAGWTNAVISEIVPVASLVAIRVLMQRRKPIWFPVLLLIASATFSLSVQIAVAEQHLAGWIASAVPAVAFMALGKLAMTLLLSKPKAAVPEVGTAAGDSAATVGDSPAPTRLSPAGVTATLSPAELGGPVSHLSLAAGQSGAAPLTPSAPVAAVAPVTALPAGAREAGAEPAGEHRGGVIRAAGSPRRPSPQPAQPSPARSSRPARPVAAVRHSTAPAPAPTQVRGRMGVPSAEEIAVVADLLTIGREVAALLAEQGQPLSRPTLVGALRERQVSIKTDRAAVLTRVLKAEIAAGGPVIDGTTVAASDVLAEAGQDSPIADANDADGDNQPGDNQPGDNQPGDSEAGDNAAGDSRAAGDSKDMRTGDSTVGDSQVEDMPVGDSRPRDSAAADGEGRAA